MESDNEYAGMAAIAHMETSSEEGSFASSRGPGRNGRAVTLDSGVEETEDEERGQRVSACHRALCACACRAAISHTSTAACRAPL